MCVGMWVVLCVCVCVCVRTCACPELSQKWAEIENTVFNDVVSLTPLGCDVPPSALAKGDATSGAFVGLMCVWCV